MIFANPSAPMNAQSPSSCSLEFLHVKIFFFVQVPPFFAQTVFYLQSTRIDLILEECRNLLRLENDVVLLGELWPIDRLLSQIDRRLCGLRNRWLSIDRLACHDRSALLLSA